MLSTMLGNSRHLRKTDQGSQIKLYLPTLRFPVVRSGTLAQLCILQYSSAGGATTNFGDVPGFYESGDRQYVAIANNEGVSQVNFSDLINAAAYLSESDCSYADGCMVCV